MVMLVSKDFTAAKKLPQWGSISGSLDQESNAYTTQPTWHVFARMRLLDPYVVMC